MAKEIVWDKVFKKSELVDVQKVEFQNRFGIKLSGDLYLPKNLKKRWKTSCNCNFRAIWRS